MSESVAQRLAAPRCLPNTPPLTAWPNGEWADSTGKWTDLKIWTVAVDPGPCSLAIASTPSAFGVTGQGNGVWGSAYCSASLHAVGLFRSSQVTGFKFESIDNPNPNFIL